MTPGFKIRMRRRVAAVLACVAYAAEVRGIPMGRICSVKIVAAKDRKAAQNRTRDCDLMDECVEAGYGVFTADGNQKAQPALRASQKKDNIGVQATGERSGDSMTVTAIQIL